MTQRVPGYLQPLADALIDARRTRTPIRAGAFAGPHDDADAYAVQDAVADAFGWFAGARPRAWKVGAAARDATPSAAPLPPGAVRDSPATFAAGSFNAILIEGEIAFRLRTALTGDVNATDVQRIAAAIGELVVTIEVVDPRYADRDDANPAMRLADQALHGALVMGSAMPYREPIDWASQVATLRCDGKVAKETRGGHPLGDLRYLLGWLAGHAAQRGYGLAAGDLVTAGSWTGVFAAAPGQTIDVEFPGIGRAAVRFS